MPTFYDRFLECAQRWPNNTALELQRHDHLESCTYGELHSWAESVGRWITENKIAPGSRLAILADNHPRWVAAYLGIIASGCAAVPLDTNLHDDQIAKLLKDSGTTAVFVDVKHVPVTRRAVSELKVGLILIDPDRMTPRRRARPFPRELARHIQNRAGLIPASAGEHRRSRFPALHLRHYRRPQGRHANAWQFPRRSRRRF